MATARQRPKLKATAYWPTMVMQPAGSSLCGQACVAMLANRDLDNVAVNRFGHRHGTHWHECRRALIALGMSCSPMRKGMPPFDSVALCRVRWDKSSRSHFVVWNRGLWMDPDSGAHNHYVNRPLPPHWGAAARITNHVTVTPA